MKARHHWTYIRTINLSLLLLCISLFRSPEGKKSWSLYFLTVRTLYGEGDPQTEGDDEATWENTNWNRNWKPRVFEFWKLWTMYQKNYFILCTLLRPLARKKTNWTIGDDWVELIPEAWTPIIMASFQSQCMEGDFIHPDLWKQTRTISLFINFHECRIGQIQFAWTI